MSSAIASSKQYNKCKENNKNGETFLHVGDEMYRFSDNQFIACVMIHRRLYSYQPIPFYSISCEQINMNSVTGA